MEKDSKNLLGQYGLNNRKDQISRFGYDGLNRRISSIFDDGSKTEYVYDGGGRLTNITDTVSGPISFAYDNLDRLINEITPQGSVNYGYDAIGRRISMSMNGGTPITYSYDTASRLTQVAQGTQTIGLRYDASGRRMTLIYPNGITTNYIYDQASRLTRILHQKSLPSPLGGEGGGEGIIEDLTYTYDAAGNRISFTRSGPQAALPQPVQAAYDAANEMIQFNNATPNLTYDANGNLISQTDANGTTTYTWDSRNRLVGISGPGVSASFAYDALGRRIQKSLATPNSQLSTSYLYDGNDIIAEIGGSLVGATYLRSLNIDEPFVRQSSANEYYHSDALGSVLDLTDQTGAIQTTYSYDPFGNTTITGTSTNPFQYTGRENDGTGLYYYRARYYSPGLQRFISEDPLKPPRAALSQAYYVLAFLGLRNNNCGAALMMALYQEMNKLHPYTYVKNAPVGMTDPLGLGPVSECVRYGAGCRAGNDYACTAEDVCWIAANPGFDCLRNCVLKKYEEGCNGFGCQFRDENGDGSFDGGAHESCAGCCNSGGGGRKGGDGC